MDSQQSSIVQDKIISEAEAIASFLDIVNNVIRGNQSDNPMSERTALKFLIARKFDVQRAIQLYRNHEIIRYHENLTAIDPNDANLKAELDSEKFTILKQRDPNDSAIAVFTAKLHTKSSKNNSQRKKTHRDTLQGIVYQLDSTLEDIITQRNGVVFIYNMSNSDYSNFDFELCQKILNLLKGAYPAKLKKVLIVSPPLWFKAPFHLLRLIVREKLRDRVWMLRMDQLTEHVPSSCLTSELGGTYEHNHQAWIEECNTLHKTKNNDLCDPMSAQTLVKSSSQKSALQFKQSSQDDSNDLIPCNDAKRPKIGDKVTKLIAYDYDETGSSLSQFVEHVRSTGRNGLGDEYDTIRARDRSNPYTFLVSSSPINMRKNRYTDVRCYDHTRVVLEPYDLPNGILTNDPMDYINANYVDGYKQSRAYVSTQGPSEHTFMDFWRMVWQTGGRVIVMVTLNVESNILKCDRYWPTSDDRIMKVGSYSVEYMSIEHHDHFKATQLKLTNLKSEVSRDIWHLQFISWPDFGTPQTATALLRYREFVLKKQLDAMEMAACRTYPPIIVHCSAGVGRSGTFVTIDICIQKLETTGLVDVKSTVEKLREQRYLSVQNNEQYIFCYKSVYEYAMSCGLLDGLDLAGIL